MVGRELGTVYYLPTDLDFFLNNGKDGRVGIAQLIITT